ncbi:N-acetylmuramoyl-L-alanine amidase [Nocardioides stalactiti]|uniref:N-acetylmuramoyl-L-alanine amidase n=1 Tax=Nocardioides stalactiti TaxID=2755356 RepID=UPI0015FF5A6D|nr:N-acetylmuramoyl-L-alanine amidase [Nocardioides stalactiti]
MSLIKTLPAVALLATALPVVSAGDAHADTEYLPTYWNGKKVYLSVACHDGNDDIPGGDCISNSGCDGYWENGASNKIANAAVAGDGAGRNLLERFYYVSKGRGTLNENVENSNEWGADLHVPLHTNASNETCSNTNAGAHGTKALYEGSGDERCARILQRKVGADSPGTDDDPVKRDDLGELSLPDAPSCYLEAEFHTWQKGVDWIRKETSWSYRIGGTVDEFFGY